MIINPASVFDNAPERGKGTREKGGRYGQTGRKVLGSKIRPPAFFISGERPYIFERAVLYIRVTAEILFYEVDACYLLSSLLASSKILLINRE